MCKMFFVFRIFMWRCSIAYSMNVQKMSKYDDNETIILQMLKTNRKIVTPTQITDAGIPRRYLSAMVEAGMIYRVERGIYTLPGIWEDELFFA